MQDLTPICSICSLDKMEEDFIRLGGGPQRKGGQLENKRYQMNEQRYREAGGKIEKPTD